LKVVFYYPAVTPQTDFPTWEPLQILFLAKMMRDKDIDVEIIDGRITSADEELKTRFLEAIDDSTICLGITSLTCYQMIDAVRAMNLVKSLFPNFPIVLGGWHASIFSEEIIKLNQVDVVVAGQGENSFLEVVQRLSLKKSLSGIKGILWKNSSGIVKEKERELESLDNMPNLLPDDFKLLDLKNYQCNKIMYYMSSVGCPYSCNYCCIGANSKQKWIGLSSENVIFEIENLWKAFKFKELIFWDNVFFINKKRVEAICHGLIQKKIDITWSAHGRINEVISWDDTFIELLRKSGCKSIFIGVESGSQNILDGLNKGIKARDVIPALKKLKKYGIGVAVNYMVGLPGETHNDIKQTIRSIMDGLNLYGFDLNLFQVFIYKFVPFPKTKIYRQLDHSISSDLPSDSIDWANYIHYKVNDGMEPWEKDNSNSLFASSIFFLWKGYLANKKPESIKTRVLMKIARARISIGFYRFPLEWHLWKMLKNKSTND
jgi:radical SAM superfamily enzyme YgiQ (UPF0313 family)